MKISVSFGRRGSGSSAINGPYPRVSKTGWELPRHRVDVNRRSVVCERDQVAGSGRVSNRGGRKGALPCSGRLGVLDGQMQVEKEVKDGSRNRSVKKWRSYAEVVAAPLVVGLERRAAGSCPKGVFTEVVAPSHSDAIPQESRMVDNTKAPMSSLSASHSLPGFNFRQVGSKDGKPSICFSAAEIKSGIGKFKNSIVLKFHSARPAAVELKRFIASQWKVKGKFNFSEIWDSSHVIVMLHSEAEVRRAYNCHVRSVGSCRFKAFRWTAEYDPKKQGMLRRFWILLPDLPLFLYDKRFVEVIISSFAKLIHLDEASELCRNLNCMRVRIEIEEDKAIPDMIWIDLPNLPGYWQKIQIEGSACLKCCSVHHSNGKCAILDEAVTGDTVDDDLSNGAHSEYPMERPVEDADQWHLVSHAKNKRVESSSKESGHVLGKDGKAHIDAFDKVKDQINGAKVVAPSTHVSIEKAMGSTSHHGVPNISNESDGVDGCTHVTTNMTMTKVSLEKAVGPREAFGVDGSTNPSSITLDIGSVEMSISHVTPSHKIGSTMPISHVALSMAPTNCSLGKGVGTTCLSDVPNVVKDGDGSDPCHSTIAYCAPNIAATSVVPSDNSRGSLILPNQLNSAKEGTKSPYTPNYNVDKHACSTRVKQVAPCDSLDLLRKKVGIHKLVYSKGGQNDQSSGIPIAWKLGHEGTDVDQKIDSYGNLIFGYQEGGHSEYLNARGFYQRLKANHRDDANIFQIMDKFIMLSQDLEEGSSSPIETEDDLIDLSRILKQPRQKSKGSRHSGRLGPKKKDSVYV